MQCLVVMSHPCVVAFLHVSNDKGDDVGGEAVVATCTSRERMANNHNGVTSFSVELDRSINNNNAKTIIA